MVENYVDPCKIKFRAEQASIYVVARDTPAQIRNISPKGISKLTAKRSEKNGSVLMKECIRQTKEPQDAIIIPSTNVNSLTYSAGDRTEPRPSLGRT